MAALIIFTNIANLIAFPWSKWTNFLTRYIHVHVAFDDVVEMLLNSPQNEVENHNFSDLHTSCWITTAIPTSIPVHPELPYWVILVLHMCTCILYIGNLPSLTYPFIPAIPPSISHPSLSPSLPPSLSPSYSCIHMYVLYINHPPSAHVHTKSIYSVHYSLINSHSEGRTTP